MNGNQKRIETCRKIGGEVKRKGHQIEKIFNKQFNSKIDIIYSATADSIISHECKFISKIKTLNLENYNVSIKSGKNIQFVLGKIEELNIENNLEYIKKNCKDIMKIYLKKSKSKIPCEIFCYYDIEKWIFFNINHIINFIDKKCIWRKLKSGRIKGDFKDNSKNEISQYLTYEYRKTHKSYFLGANGNKGKKFIELLKNNIQYVEINVENQ